jgi:5-formaminoimidazole-4-carboxamide-1-(beta)-D-ribofuranosyl 5'-monophosphate synthetase
MSEEYVARALDAYDLSRLTLCSIGSHSALDVASGARAQGLRNLIVTAKGREKTYTRYFLREESPVGRGCVDGVLELQNFPEILNEDVQHRLFEQNVIFVANRSFEVYLHQEFEYDEIERRMLVPFFGNRHLLRAEERTLRQAQGDKGEDQYALMRAAGIRHPHRYESPD